MTRLLVVAALVLIFATSTGPATGATPEPRIALVIGNSAYKDAPLANPVNDARLMAETLRGLGFEVIERTDANQREMKLAIFELGDRLEAAGKEGVGLFFYAGHGVQVNGQNYLIPLNAMIEKERHVAIEAVGASWVLSQMEFAGNRVNFVILDACRNNPLTRGFRSQLRGLAKMNAPTGSLVAYSTGPGDVAADGEGANSPYTLALSQAMKTPGVAAEKMFKLVRNSVREETKGKQTPWEESSMMGADFYFNPASAVATTESPSEEQGTPAPVPLYQDGAESERLFWESIKDSDDPADFEAYLGAYPDGTFAPLARNQLRRLKKQVPPEQVTVVAAVVPPPEAAITVEEMDATFVALKTSNLRAEPTTTSKRVGRISRDSAVTVTGTVEDGKWYRVDYEGQTAFVFGTLVEEVEPYELAAWRKIARSSDYEDFSLFLDEYPNSIFTERAEAKLAALAITDGGRPPTVIAALSTSVGPNAAEMAFWDSIKHSDEPADYRAYLQAYPGGSFAELARVRASTALAALPPRETEAVTRPKRSGRVINVQPIHDFRGQAKPILTDILRNVLRAVPNAVVISEQPGGDDDVVVSGSVLKFAQREEPNPDYQAAQIAASLFGGLAAAMTANIPRSHTLIDVEVLISAQDAATGETFSESGYANLKLDSRQTNPTRAGFDALQTAVTQAAKRIVIRLTGGTPQQQVTAAEVSNDANLKRAIKRFYNKQRFWKSHGSKNRPTEMVDIYDISLASVSDNLIKLDVRYRWQLQDMHAGKNANGIATVERAGNSFRVLGFQ